MGDDSLSGLLLVVGLIVVHAGITLMYAALVNTRVAWLDEQIEGGSKRARQTLALVQRGTALSMTYQVIATLLRFSIAGSALLIIGEPVTPGDTLSPLLVDGLLLFTAAALTLILGDIVPEAVGSSYAQGLALAVTPFMRGLVTVMSPLVVAVLQVSRALSALLGSSRLVNTVTEEEIMTLVDAGYTGGTIEDEEKAMIYSVLQLDQTRASEVMVPRIDIVAVDIDTPPSEVGEIIIQSGYSRIPVYEGHIDNIKGLLYAKDLLAHCYRSDSPLTSIRELMRAPHFVPETKPADELLKELQGRKVHLAVVVDEYGGTAGIVTIENIIEEIIGDIQDEHDLNEEAEYEQIGPDEYTMDASIDLDDVNEMLNLDLPTEDSDTLGGFIYTHFGRVPEVGETIEDELFSLQVRSVEGRRIRKVHMIRKRQTAGDEADGHDEARRRRDDTEAASSVTDEAQL